MERRAWHLEHALENSRRKGIARAHESARPKRRSCGLRGSRQKDEAGKTDDRIKGGSHEREEWERVKKRKGNLQEALKEAIEAVTSSQEGKMEMEMEMRRGATS